MQSSSCGKKLFRSPARSRMSTKSFRHTAVVRRESCCNRRRQAAGDKQGLAENRVVRTAAAPWAVHSADFVFFSCVDLLEQPRKA